MTSEPIDIRSISAEQTRPLRAEVLRPGRPFEETIFGGDEHADTLHVGAFTADGRIVGIASVTPEPCAFDAADGDWQLRGMATSSAFRGQGIGSAVLEECLRLAKVKGARRMWCNGRTTALRFYQRLGFRPIGEEFERPNTGPHFVLICDL